MTSSTYKTAESQSLLTSFRPGLNWPTLIGGLFISFLVYWALVSLGLGLGSIGLQSDRITSDRLTTLSFGAVAWLLTSCLLSLALGTYAYIRLSNTSRRTGATIAQAAVVTSFFFTIMVSQASLVIVPVISGSLQAVASAGSSLAESPRIQNYIEDSVSGLELRGIERPELISSLGARLISNDQTSLRSLLAQHSNMSQAEIEISAARLEQEFRRLSTEITNATGRAIATSAFTLFLAIVCGFLGACIGGLLANNANSKLAKSNWYGRDISNREPHLSAA